MTTPSSLPQQMLFYLIQSYAVYAISCFSFSYASLIQLFNILSNTVPSNFTTSFWTTLQHTVYHYTILCYTIMGWAGLGWAGLSRSGLAGRCWARLCTAIQFCAGGCAVLYSTVLCSTGLGFALLWCALLGCVALCLAESCFAVQSCARRSYRSAILCNPVRKHKFTVSRHSKYPVHARTCTPLFAAKKSTKNIKRSHFNLSINYHATFPELSAG